MKRILYVDRGLIYRESVTFAEGLRALGEVRLMESLSPEVAQTVRRALEEGRPFDAVVSHLPPIERSKWPPYTYPTCRRNEVYGPAFFELGKIKEIADIPIMVYTGAAEIDVPPIPWEMSGVDGVLHKSCEPEDDARRMVGMINKAEADYAAWPKAAAPCFDSDAESTWVETTVRLNSFVGSAAAAKLVTILGGFEWRAERLGGNAISGETEANDILGLICMELYWGSRLRIRVKGVSPDIRQALGRAHRLLNSKYLWQYRR